MARIYVSYSRKDGDFMRALVNRLKQDGHEITVDDDVLTAGRDWRSTLDEGLKSADVFLTLLS
jgi:pyrimidine operon attenuation protein/uracil phosphoribosyltransferase